MDISEIDIGKAKIAEVASALTELNTEINGIASGGKVRSFYLEYDRDVQGWAANLIWLVRDMPEAKIDESADLNEPDLLLDLCGLGTEKLSSIVAVTYCDYRTESEYQEQYETDYWKSQLVELPHAA